MQNGCSLYPPKRTSFHLGRATQRLWILFSFVLLGQTRLNSHSRAHSYWQYSCRRAAFALQYSLHVPSHAERRGSALAGIGTLASRIKAQDANIFILQVFGKALKPRMRPTREDRVR